ncbi:hypothetical protein KUTeg_000986 [Tegillarca granosa]|uniref:Nuclease HARBI1 n=1 Tax=Tegillarca granosa TaxID=220873 RepID=A0ABQ9G0J1_TEGGR|nr:hypothetical protein KUTeg_000986 [Tegillarca granosa]
MANYLDRLRQLDDIPVQRNVLRERNNPLEEYNNVDVFKRYRFEKDNVVHIFHTIKENKYHLMENRGLPIPPMLQLLATLRFYVTGTLESVQYDLYNISQSSVSRIVSKESGFIAAEANNYIRFPTPNNYHRIFKNILLLGPCLGL